MKSLTIIILSSLAFTACSSTRQIRSDDPRSLSSIASKHNQEVRITLHSGEQHAGTQLEMQPDSTRWQDRQRGVQRTVRTADIAQVTLINRGKGAAQGLLLGLFAGATVGLLVGTAIPEDDPCETGGDGLQCIGHVFGGSLANEARGMNIGALVGGLTGLATGITKGNQKHFVLLTATQRNVCAAVGCTLSHEQTKTFYVCNRCHLRFGTEHISYGKRCPSCRRGFVK